MSEVYVNVIFWSDLEPLAVLTDEGWVDMRTIDELLSSTKVIEVYGWIHNSRVSSVLQKFGFRYSKVKGCWILEKSFTRAEIDNILVELEKVAEVFRHFSYMKYYINEKDEEEILEELRKIAHGEKKD
jgi:hypothetical protein